MNKILLLIFILLMVGCRSDNSTKEEKRAKMAKKANREIENNIEKIFLLSQIEKIEYNKIKEILESYFIVTLDRNSILESKEDYDDLIRSISDKTDLSSSKISSIIFSYQYEMRTKEEIGEEYLEELDETNEKYYEDMSNSYYR